TLSIRAAHFSSRARRWAIALAKGSGGALGLREATVFGLVAFFALAFVLGVAAFLTFGLGLVAVDFRVEATGGLRSFVRGVCSDVRILYTHRCQEWGDQERIHRGDVDPKEEEVEDQGRDVTHPVPPPRRVAPDEADHDHEEAEEREQGEELVPDRGAEPGE